MPAKSRIALPCLLTPKKRLLMGRESLFQFSQWCAKIILVLVRHSGNPFRSEAASVRTGNSIQKPVSRLDLLHSLSFIISAGCHPRKTLSS